MEKIKNFIVNYSIYLVLLIAAVLRFKKIGNRDFWYDEAFTGVAIKERFIDMLNMIINDVHPPLYYVSVKIFASFFNYSVFGIRIYSAIFGVLGIWAVYLFAKNLFGKKAALWASVIMAISPFAIQYSQEARMYSMFGFLFVLASHFFIRGLESGERKYYLLWGLFLGLSSLTHYMGIIIAPIFIFVFAGWKIFHENIIDDVFRKKFKFSKIKNLFLNRTILAGYGIFSLVFSFWIPVFFKHLFKAGSLAWIKPATVGDIFTNIHIFFFGSPLGEMTGGLSGVPVPNELDSISSNSITIALVFFFVAITLFLFGREKKKEKIISIIILSFGYLAIVYFLSLTGIHYLVSRYLLPIAYFLYVLVGLWASKIKFYYAAPLFVTYLLLLNLIVPVQNSTGWDKLQKDAKKFEGREFYILNPFDYVIAKYYLDAEHLIIYNFESPQHSHSNWAAIGLSGKRTENFDDIKNKNGIIISNTILKDELNNIKNGEYEYGESLNIKGLKINTIYDNIVLYEF